MTTTKATTSASATSKAEQDAAQKANSDRFYAAKHDLFFCAEVIKLAAFAASAHRTLSAYDNAMDYYQDERAKIEKLVDAPRDWTEFQVGLDWSLSFTHQRMTDAMDTMETAFMAAERAAETAKP